MPPQVGVRDIKPCLWPDQEARTAGRGKQKDISCSSAEERRTLEVVCRKAASRCVIVDDAVRQVQI